MGLGLSHIGPQLTSIKDQPTPPHSTDILRLGGGLRSTQFDHLMTPSSSSFRSPSQSMPPPPAFFMQEPTHQNYNEDNHQKQQFHGLMQFPDNSNNNLFNLNFLSNTTTTSTTTLNNNSNINLIESSNTNTTTSNTLFSNMINDQVTTGMPSLFSENNNNMMSHNMSATALLQKAAQMGSSSSTNNTASLLRSFGSSSSTKPSFGNMFANENDNNLQDLMNSFAAGNTSSWTGDAYGFKPSSDRTTRDFLGVGQIVRSISGSGGFAQREKQHQHDNRVDVSSLDSERNVSATTTTTTTQSFGGGSFQ